VSGTIESRKRKGWKGESSDYTACRKLAGTVQTWRDVVVSSRHEQQQPEKLGRRQSTTVSDGQSVMMITLSEDDLEPRGPKTGQIRRRDTVVLSRANIWTSGQRVILSRAFSQCSRWRIGYIESYFDDEKPVWQQSWSLTGAVKAGTTECQRQRLCRSPAVTRPRTPLTTY